MRPWQFAQIQGLVLLILANQNTGSAAVAYRVLAVVALVASIIGAVVEMWHERR